WRPLVFLSLFPSRCVLSLSLDFLHTPARPDLSTLSLHDALPISFQIEAGLREIHFGAWEGRDITALWREEADALEHYYRFPGARSEEHTSELQSRENLVCRLLLEKKK